MDIPFEISDIDVNDWQSLNISLIFETFRTFKEEMPSGNFLKEIHFPNILYKLTTLQNKSLR